MSTERPGYDRIDWLAMLRARFTEVATRRVVAEDVERVVSEAMRAVIDSEIAPGVASIQGSPPLAWCFQVLRNTIGRYFRDEALRERRLALAHSASPTALAKPVECISARDLLPLVEAAVEKMGATEPHCALFFNRFVEGAHPHEIIAEDDLDPVAFHRYMYGCRRKLRELLRSQGVDL
jgi:DNA-directed RNA polymerase specialized sigma24 family protein